MKKLDVSLDNREFGVALLVCGWAWLLRLFLLSLYLGNHIHPLDWVREVFRIRPVLDSLVGAVAAIVCGFVLLKPWRSQ